jgi:CMP-N-acetylneuraminic acid synthetase
MVNKKIAIIPARGGSKRIPRKNIKELNGKPLIGYTIENVKKSNLFDKVIVSTDDEEIKNISIAHGAEVPFLRDKHADDNSTVSQAVCYTLTKLKELGENFDIVSMCMPSCPLRDEQDIHNAYKYFINNKYKFQISGFEYGWMNPWWAHTIDEDKGATSLFKKEEWYLRSQDLKKTYCLTGAIWFAYTNELLNSNDFYSEPYNIFPIHWKNAIDIDEIADFEMAEFFLKNKINNNE